MFNSLSKLASLIRPTGATRAMWVFTLTLLVIEFLDELVFGVQGAVLPVIRTDLALTYAEIGMLLSLPKLVGNAVEPVLGILGDVWRRKAVIAGGGVIFTLSLALVAAGQTFPALLLAFTLFNPASGAFVSLSQATLMDLNPTRHEQMMARWTLAGSLGVVGGPLLVSAALSVSAELRVSAGFSVNWSWRELYVAMAILAALLVWFVWRQPHLNGTISAEASSFVDGVKSALQALRKPGILRWLILLESADLMLDVLLGFLALYFVDVVGVTEIQAGLAVAVWSIAGLVGDVLIIPMLERVRGLAYLRWSAVAQLGLYTGLLLAPGVTVKYVLLALLALSSSGWYAILKAQLYSAMPGQSGISMAISSISGLAGGLIPWGLGLAAQSFGLPIAMALLALGPISLIVGLIEKTPARPAPRPPD